MVLIDGFDDVRDIAVRFAGTQYYWTGCEYGLPQPLAFDSESVEIIVAVYEQGSYDGQAFVVFKGRDNEFYEVNASHCSCYGLEGQWKPEGVVIKELLARPTYIYGSDNTKIRAALTDYFG